MKIQLVVLLMSVLSISSCGGASKNEALSAEQLSAYAKGYERGWADGCYEVFKANIGGGTLYANNSPVSYEQCLSSIGVPDYDNSSLYSDMDLNWIEDKGYPSGVGGAFDFAFTGGRSLCFEDECVTEELIYSNLG